MRCGSGLNRFCRERQRTPAGRRIIGCFLKRCCGVSARDRRHEPVRAGSSRVLWEREPYRPALSSVPLSSGCRRDFLSVVSACYPTHSIGRSYRWTGRSCKPMPRPPGRKKGLIERHRTLEGGLTSKIVALTDAIGKLIRFVVLPGPSHDRVAIPMLLDPVTLWISRHGSATWPVTRTPYWIGLRNTESRR